MKNICILLVLSVLVAMSGFAQEETRKEEVIRPNILLIVADDLGWTDLGSFGS